MNSKLVETLRAVGQEQLLSYRDELEKEQKAHLIDELSAIDWLELQKIYQNEVLPRLDQTRKKLIPAVKIEDELLERIPNGRIDGTSRCSESQLGEYRSIGYDNIKTGKVAAILLSGGQGTRLGVDYPKGMFDVGLPEAKSLFELQADRIRKLKDETGGSRIIWYIMTSEATTRKTRSFFEDKNFFQLEKDDVIFFEQGTMPCFGFDGKVLLDEKWKLARSPDGNGGLFDALNKNGILEHMDKNGVEFVHVYCVDNILVRICDPAFLGYCISNQADAAAKVVEKQTPDEAVGTICKVGNKYKVIEYSEISDSIAQRRDESSGKLVFNAGNICEHFFRVRFLKTITGNSKKLSFHIAIKKVPHLDLNNSNRIEKPQQACGIKLEKFIFDVFEFTDHFFAWEVRREDEFAPLKNAVGTEKDNPTTARLALMRARELGLLD